MKHLIAFLGYNQSRIQHPVYRQFMQASLVKRNTSLLFPTRSLEERELVHVVNELRRREGIPSELGFHICATLDDPTMGQQIIQALTLIRRLYDRPSYVYCLLPDFDICSEEQRKIAWNCLVTINNGITDYPEVHLLSHCFLYHDASQISLAHFLFDITQEAEALDMVDRYGYLNKLLRPKQGETVGVVDLPSIFSSFNVSGVCYPEDEIRHFIHQSYLNALLSLSRPSGNPVSMEECNDHVQAILSHLPLSEDLIDLTGQSFIDEKQKSGAIWLQVDDYWQKAVERVMKDLQDKPRDEWVSQLRANLEVYYQTRYRDMGVEYFYRHEKQKTSEYSLDLLYKLKDDLQQTLLNSTYPPETAEDIVRSIVNHLQQLALHFNCQHNNLTEAIAQADARLKELSVSWDGFGFFDRMRGKDKSLFEEYRQKITQYYIDRVKLQGADFAIKLLNEFIPYVSAMTSGYKHLAQICQDAISATRHYLSENSLHDLKTDFPLEPILEVEAAIRKDNAHLKEDFRMVAEMLYGTNPPHDADDFALRLREEFISRIDTYLHQHIQDGSMPPILDVSIVERVLSLYRDETEDSNEQDEVKAFVAKLKKEAAIPLRLKGYGGHKEQYLLIAPECGGQLGPQIVGADSSSIEMMHILTGICLSDLEGFAGQRMFVEPSIF